MCVVADNYQVVLVMVFHAGCNATLSLNSAIIDKHHAHGTYRNSNEISVVQVLKHCFSNNVIGVCEVLHLKRLSVWKS